MIAEIRSKQFRDFSKDRPHDCEPGLDLRSFLQLGSRSGTEKSPEMCGCSLKYTTAVDCSEMFEPADSLPSHKSTQPHPIVWGGVGWGGGGMITTLAFPHDLDATLYDLHWHFHMILMLRSMIFIGNST